MWLLDNFWRIFGKWSEIFGKSPKTSLLVCLCTWLLVDMEFLFSCSTLSLNTPYLRARHRLPRASMCYSLYLHANRCCEYHVYLGLKGAMGMGAILHLKSLSANTIMAKLTNHVQRTRLITSSTDKDYSLDSEDDFRSGCRSVSHQQQFFSELPSPGRSHYTNY